MFPMTNNAENLTDTYQYILVKLSFGIVTGQFEHTIPLRILSHKDIEVGFETIKL